MKTSDVLVKDTKDGKTTMKEPWKRFSIRGSTMLVCEAWKAVTRSCMNAA
jgi:hypothetical protein